MDSLTQIILGASVAEAAVGKQMGLRAALWGAIAATIPDLDVFIGRMYHPIDAAQIHRGFSHSLLFALIAAPILAWIVNKLYRGRYAVQLWRKLFFLAIVTHPMLDIFTNYGTEFLWPFSLRITFNSIFIIDPLYTIPFLIMLLIALFHKKENPNRQKWNKAGLIYSSTYLLYCVVAKLFILYKSDDYFSEAGLNTKNTMVTPMPLTSFYWLMLTEDEKNFYVAYKSYFYKFDASDIDTIPKHQQELDRLKWQGKNYAKKLRFISSGYFTTYRSADTLMYYDLRFGTADKMTNGKVKTPIMGYGMVIDNNTVQKTMPLRGRNMTDAINFDAYISNIFKNE